MAASAEAICAYIYANRGLPPVAESRDWDDQMALEANWHADLLAVALEGLDASGASDELFYLIEEAAELEMRAAELYAEHMLVSQELDAIRARQDELSDEVEMAAEADDAPSCAALVADP